MFVHAHEKDALVDPRSQERRSKAFKRPPQLQAAAGPQHLPSGRSANQQQPVCRCNRRHILVASKPCSLVKEQESYASTREKVSLADAFSHDFRRKSSRDFHRGGKRLPSCLRRQTHKSGTDLLSRLRALPLAAGASRCCSGWEAVLPPAYGHQKAGIGPVGSVPSVSGCLPASGR